MIYGLDEECEVRHSQESPCNGTYTVAVPRDREAARPLSSVRLNGVALAKGTYRVKFERIGDA